MAVLRLSLLLVVFAAQACTPTQPFEAGSRPMSVNEIREMYAGRTWAWDEGAGYFGPGGAFQAWFTDDAGRRGFGTGRWTADNQGLLCFEAAWQSAGLRTTGERCFRHRVWDGAVYQRAESRGEATGQWYVFRNSPPLPDDPARQLTQGNAVAEVVGDIRS